MSLLLSQVPAPFDPGSSGFPYQQQPSPPAHGYAQRCVALALTACSLVVVPPPVDPSNNPSWLPSYPDFPARGPKRPVNELPGAAAVPPFQFGTAVDFNNDPNSALRITTFLPGPQSFSVSTFFQFTNGLPSNAGTVWMLQDTNGTTPAHYIDLEINSVVNADSVSVASDSATIEVFRIANVDPDPTDAQGAWYFVQISVGTGGTATAYWCKVGTPIQTTDVSGVSTGWTPASFNVGGDDFGEFFPGAITGMNVWSATRSSSDATKQATQIAPVVLDGSLTYSWKLEHTATKLHSELPGRDLTAFGAGTWTEDPGPFLQPGIFNPKFGFPYEQQPQSPPALPRNYALLDSGGGCDFVFSPTAAFNPSTGFPWDQLPDLVRAPARDVALLGGPASFVFTPTGFDPATGFPWEQSPGPVPPAARSVALLGGQALVIQEREPTVDWLGEYPDFVLPAPRSVNAGGQATFDNVDFVRFLSWGPEFADFARAAVRPVNEGGEAPLVIQEREPVVDWLPAFPDFPGRGLLRPVNEGGYAPFDNFDFVPKLSWAPSYPDFPARAAPRPVNEGGVFRTHVEYEPTDWFPYYQDFAPAAPRALELREGGSSYVNPEFVPYLSWSPSYPDFAARAALRPVNTGGLSWTNVEREPTTDWISEYPDFPGRGSLRPVNEGGQAPFDNFDFVPKLSWSPSYPDFPARAAPRPVNTGGEFRTHLEYEPTDWFPYYQDFVVPAPRALELREGGASFVSIDVAPPLSWAPIFPDFPGRAALRPVNTGGLSWTNVEYEPSTDWLPKFPDFAGRSALRPVNEGGYAPFDNFDFVPRLSWAPSYPDFAARAALRPVNQGGLTWTNVEYEPTDWFPSYPDFAPAAMRAVELREGGASFDNFDFVPKLSWAPSYPDFARAAARPVNQGGEFRTHVEYEPTDWFPYFQDFVLAAPRALELREGGASFVDPDFVPKGSWAPTYPDFPARAALRPVNEGGTFRTHLEYEPTDWFPSYPDFAPSAPRATDLRETYAFVNPEFVPYLAWAPSYPDFARSRVPPVRTGHFALVIEEREPDVDWLPSYPDFARGPQRPVNEGGVFRTHLEYEPTDWFPSYADFAYAPVRSVNVGGQAPFVNREVAPKLSWAPSYPDFARAPKSPVNEGGAFKAPFTPVFAFFQPFYPDYPDFALAAPRPVNTGGLFWTNLEYEPTTDWLPAFPDFARAAQRPVNTGGAFAPSLTIRAPLTDWLPDYPDFARGPKPLVNTGITAFVSTDVAPKLSWSPNYPDFPGRAALRPVNTGGLSWTNVEREPDVDWLPGYPDFARTAPRPVNQGGLSWTNLEHEPFVDWLPEFPDFARVKPSPVNQGGLTWTNVEYEPTTDWLPGYPDFAPSAPRPLNTGGAFFESLDYVPSLAWSPQYPNPAFPLAKLPVNEGGSASFVDLVTTPPAPLTHWYPDFPDFAYGPRRVRFDGNIFRSFVTPPGPIPPKEPKLPIQVGISVAAFEAINVQVAQTNEMSVSLVDSASTQVFVQIVPPTTFMVTLTLIDPDLDVSGDLE